MLRFLVMALIIFSYTGELLLPISLRNEFLSLCQDMQVDIMDMVDIPKLDDLITANDDIDNVVQVESAICDEDLCRAPDMQTDDEYFVEEEKYEIKEETTSDEEETIEDTSIDNTDRSKKSSAFQGNLKQAIEAVKKGGEYHTAFIFYVNILPN